MFKEELVASRAGEASVAVELDADSLLARRGLLQQAMLASAVPSRRVLAETEQPVRVSVPSSRRPGEPSGRAGSWSGSILCTASQALSRKCLT
jgi:hypothetical protein